MKNIYIILTLLVITITFSTTYSQNVGINTDGSDPDGSAMLDVKSTSKGMLIPRMTTAQRGLVSSPAIGLLVYDTDEKSLFYFDGTDWLAIKNAKGIEDDDGKTKVYVIGTDNFIYFMTDSVTRMTVDPDGVIDIGEITVAADGTLRINSGTGQESSLTLNSGTSGLRIYTNSADTINIENISNTADTRMVINSGTGQESSLTLNSGTSGLRISTNDTNPDTLNISNISETNDTRMLINSGTGQESSLTLRSGDTENYSVVVNGSNLAIAIDGTDAMIVEPDGTVGIGTSNPDNTFALDVGGDVHTSGLIRSGNSIIIDGVAYEITTDSIIKIIGGSGEYMRFQEAGNIGIGTTTPDSKSILDISAAQKGILIPRMTSSMRDGINPATSSEGLLIYQTDNTPGFYYWNGSAWENITKVTNPAGASSAIQFNNAGSFGGNSNLVWNNSNLNLGIGTTTPNASSILDLSSTSKGFLAPRMTTVQRNSIATPTAGLMVYDTDLQKYIFYNGTIWTDAAGSVTAAGASGNIQFNSSGSLGANSNLFWNNTNESLGIGTSTPDPSSALDINVSQKGLLIPRMASSMITGISSPATGLLVYDTDANSFYYYNGSAWTAVGSETPPAGSTNEIQFNDAGFFASNSNFVWDNASSRLGIGLTNPTYTLDVAGSAKVNSLNINSVYSLPTTDGTVGQVMVTSGTGSITWNDVNAKKLDGVNINAPSPTDGQILSYNSTMTQWESLTLSADYTGTGTSNNLTKWTGGNSFGNSIIQDDGTTLGVGVAPSASAKLIVDGGSTTTAVKGLYSATLFGQLGTSSYGSYGQFDVNTWGALGSNTSGVYGSASGANTGVYGRNGSYFGSLGNQSYGVYGQYSTNNWGAIGTLNEGVLGSASGTSKAIYGSNGTTLGYIANATYGIYGEFNATNYGYLGGNGIGVFGKGTTAGSFEGNVVLGNTTAASELRIHEPFAGANYTAFKAQTQAVDITYSLPTTSGSAGQVLSTSGGTAVLSWATPSSGWGLTGNSGTTDGTNFIGTTDNVPLNFRVNNQKAGKIDNSVYQLTSYGFNSAFNNSTGYDNTALGFQALYTNSVGSSNTAVGSLALRNATGGSNTAIGYQSLYSTNTPSENTAVGRSTMYANLTGQSNAAYGVQAMYNSTIGHNNTAIGSLSLYTNVAGSNGTAIGFRAMYNANDNATAFTNYNTAVGYYSMYGSATPSSNTGNYNTALGYQTLMNISSGGNNTAFGYFAGYTTTSANAVTTGSNNTFIGYNTGFASATQRSKSTAIGYNAKVDADNSFILGGIGADAVKVGIGTTTPTAFLDISASTTASASLRLRNSSGINPTTPNSGDLWWTGSNLYFYNGSASIDLLSSLPYTGTGTLNYITRWTGGTSFGNSIIQDDGTNIGIGVAPNATNKVRVSSSGTLIGLNVSQTGTVEAGYFAISNVSSASNAIFASSNGTGKVLRSYSTGTGRAGEFQIANASSSAHSIYAVTNGTGAAIFGDQTATTGSVYGVYGTSASSSGVGVYGSSQLTGIEGFVSGTTSNSSGGKFNNSSTSAANHYGVSSTINGNTGTGTKYGTYSSVSGTASANYGLYSTATGVATNSYGVYSSSVNTSTNNYGIYATASGGTNNWAGYFNGDISVTGKSNFSADITSNSARYKKIRAGVGTFTIAANDHIITVNNTSTITLPPVGANAGRELIIRSVSGATVTVNTNTGTPEMLLKSSGTFASTYNLAANGILTIVCDGTYWYCID
ncbi:MAG: hypothetical protein A2033_12135 [Bacteroidetes bacterium GWA2_31_9]|nr:MAG: hypothetical protein A2033_12135 [Bacteroidetes bacterium GWA2_31_9]